jgi:DNA replication protein DnaC
MTSPTKAFERTPLRLPDGVVPSPDPIPEGMTRDDLAELRRRQGGHIAGWYLNHRPALYATATLDDLDADQDPDGKVRGWLDSGVATLLLTGAVGTGKTHAAYAVTNAACDRSLLTVAVTVPDFLVVLRPGGDSTLAARARAAELLFLDDLGAEKPSEWTGEQLSSLIDARVREERRQIVTTNSTYDELVSRLGARTMSRLTGGSTVVQFKGDDRRRRTW